MADERDPARLDANFQVYGAVKVWRQLNCKGLEVAHRPVKRLIQRLGPGSSRRCKRVRTTVPGSSASYSLDRVNRRFRADRLKQLWGADFTYVLAWQMSSSMTNDFVLDALEQALHARN
jgi:transposase InsO family protein